VATPQPAGSRRNNGKAGVLGQSRAKIRREADHRATRRFTTDVAADESVAAR